MKIIITEQQLHNLVQEATLKNDQKFYDEAESFFDQMIDKLKKYKINLNQVNSKEPDNVFFNASVVNQKYKDLYIIFDENLENKHYAWGTALNGKYIEHKTQIRLHIYTKNVSYSDIIKQVIDKKETFIHEFIHYLDFKRLKTDAPKPVENNSDIENSSNIGYYITTIYDANNILRRNKFNLKSISDKKYYLPISDSKNLDFKSKKVIIKLNLDKLKQKYKFTTDNLISSNIINDIGHNKRMIIKSSSIPNANEYILSIDVLYNDNPPIFKSYYVNMLKISTNYYTSKEDLLLSINPINIEDFEPIKPKYDEKFFKRYFNEPLETNAYYQQAMGDAINKFQKNLAKLYNVNSFSDFVYQLYGRKGKLSNIFDERFKKYLNDKNHRKILKRLYNVYTELIKTNNQNIPEYPKKYLPKNHEKIEPLLKIVTKALSTTYNYFLKEYINGNITLEKLSEKVTTEIGFRYSEGETLYVTDEKFRKKFNEELKKWLDKQVKKKK